MTGQWEVFRYSVERVSDLWFRWFSGISQAELFLAELEKSCGRPVLGRNPADPVYSIDIPHKVTVGEALFRRLLTLFPEGLAVFVYRDRPLLNGDCDCAWEIRENALYLYREKVVSLGIEDAYTDHPASDWIGLNLSTSKFFTALPVFLGFGLSIYLFFISNYHRQVADCLLRQTSGGPGSFEKGLFSVVYFIDPVVIRGPDGNWVEFWVRPDNPLHGKFLELFPLDDPGP